MWWFIFSGFLFPTKEISCTLIENTRNRTSLQGYTQQFALCLLLHTRLKAKWRSGRDLVKAKWGSRLSEHKVDKPTVFH